MKYGQEKSDLFIIALKPTNKPGDWGGVGRAKGEDRGKHGRATHVPDTRRINVSQRLDCVREAARGIRR